MLPSDQSRASWNFQGVYLRDMLSDAPGYERPRWSGGFLCEGFDNDEREFRLTQTGFMLTSI